MASERKEKNETVSVEEINSEGNDAILTIPMSEERDEETETYRHHEALFASLTTSAAPQANRKDAVQLMSMLIQGGRPAVCDVYGNGPLLVSDIPNIARNTAVVMGIDEAGRGPALGPMTYGATFWAVNDNEAIPKGFNDSKELKPEVRSKLFQKAMETPELGFCLRVLHASEISRNMLRKEPYNLNAMSHDAAIQMIRAVLDAGVNLETCYIDTVGIASSYQAQLERIFSGRGVRFVVEKKADSKYAQCSAASVIAKVARDRMIESFQWTEKHYEPVGGLDFGSGYPSDPKCKVSASYLDPYSSVQTSCKLTYCTFIAAVTRACRHGWIRTSLILSFAFPISFGLVGRQ